MVYCDQVTGGSGKVLAKMARFGWPDEIRPILISKLYTSDQHKLTSKTPDITGKVTKPGYV